MASRRLPQLALVLLACGPATPTSTGTSPDPYAEQAGDGPPGAALAGDEGEPAAAVEPAGPGPEPAAAAPAAGGTAKPEGPPILAAHNRMRARHCAPPLTWSAAIPDSSVAIVFTVLRATSEPLNPKPTGRNTPLSDSIIIT